MDLNIKLNDNSGSQFSWNIYGKTFDTYQHAIAHAEEVTYGPSDVVNVTSVQYLPNDDSGLNIDHLLESHVTHELTSKSDTTSKESTTIGHAHNQTSTYAIITVFCCGCSEKLYYTIVITI